MDQEVRHLDPVERLVEPLAGHRVAREDRDLVGAALEGVAAQAAHAVAIGRQAGGQPRTDVAGDSRNEDVHRAGATQGAGHTKLWSRSRALRAPASASVASNSASRISSTRWAPAAPSTASPQSTGRPTIT